jgi:uncharacterized protein (DUF849 family)
MKGFILGLIVGIVLLPDGARAHDNADLVTAARRLIGQRQT